MSKRKKTSHSDPTASSARRRQEAEAFRRKRRRRVLRIAGAAAALVLALVLTLVLWPRGAVGWWDVDEYTSYRFRRNGTGSLLVPAGEYEFTYTEEDGALHIDFRSEEATDADYTILRENGVLILIRPDGGNYLLTKHKR